MSDRITWIEDERTHTARGVVGEMTLFSINWGGRGFVLRSYVPGAGPDMRSDDQDALKLRAEEALAAFAEKIGARF